MEMNYVDSTSIEAIGYDATTSELHVQFKKGATYVVAGVPQEVFDEFMNSPSKGSYYNRSIKAVFPNITRI